MKELNRSFNKLKTFKFIAGSTLVFTPLFVLLFIVEICLNKSVYSSRPFWSDEFIYWHEVLSFVNKGFNYGYYTFNEIVPPMFSFGTHGFGTISVYALFASCFGWKLYSIVIANTLFVILSLLILVMVNRLSLKKIVYVIILYITYLPILIYATTSMSELINYAVLIIYFSLLVCSLQNKNKKLLIRFLLLFTVYICFVRVIYVILLFPVFFIMFQNRNNHVLKSFIYSIILSVIVYSLNSLFVSPYPYSFLYNLLSEGGVAKILLSFIKHFLLNLIRFINPMHDDFLQIFQRYLFLLVLIWCLVRSKIIRWRFSEIDLIYLIAFFVLFFTFLINCAAYDIFDYHDYRVLSPILFGVILLIILTKKDKLIHIYFVACILNIVIFNLQSGITNFSGANERYSTIKPNTLLKQISYSVGKNNKFVNTVVIDNPDNSTILNVPAGIGISYSDKISDKLQSKYLYTSQPYNLKTYKQITVNESGFLYVKNDEK